MADRRRKVVKCISNDGWCPWVWCWVASLGVGCLGFWVSLTPYHGVQNQFSLLDKKPGFGWCVLWLGV